MISNYRYQYNYTCYLHYEWHVQLYISNYDSTFYRINSCYFLLRMDSITLDYNLKEENVKKIYYMQKLFAYLNSGSMNILHQWLNFVCYRSILPPRVTLSFYTSITCTASHNRAISNRERRKNIINSLEIYTYLYNTAIHMKSFCILICYLFIFQNI